MVIFLKIHFWPTSINTTHFSITGTVVALKEITRSEEEGTPFTAIREGKSKFNCFN